MNHPIQSLQTLRPALGVEPIHLPLFSDRVAAGFPSPADDYTEGRLSLDEHLIQHKDSTFFVRAKGNSMTGAGIFDGDLLVVDKSLDAHDGDIVVAVIDGGFTVKYGYKKSGVLLMGLQPKGTMQQTLFDDPVEQAKSDSMMSIMDAINRKMGKGSVTVASSGIRPKWAMRREKKSPSYTTEWRELPVAW